MIFSRGYAVFSPCARPPYLLSSSYHGDVSPKTRGADMSDPKGKSTSKGASGDEKETEKRGRGRPRKKQKVGIQRAPTATAATDDACNPPLSTPEPSGSPTMKRARGRPKGSSKKGATNSGKPGGAPAGRGRGRPPKKQERNEEEEGTAESSEDQ
ncbi:high mobility group protein HMG-I/HMG-Y isoform X1 [Ascaphus truei]|uniref:high mobility group protein HMG-I/HMG-Y isoform X1 n=2 Tax=Ascaphus truei TaxID=8439 RepID=UPI003F59E473